MQINYKLLLLSLTVLLASCEVGPDYKRPTAPLQDKFKEAQGKTVIAPTPSKEWKVAEPKDQSDRGKWWQVFNDAKLNELEDQLDKNNQNIANAYYNYQQAYALVDEARSAFFPTVIGSVGIVHQRPSSGGTSSSVSSSGAISPIGGGGGSSSGNTTTHTMNLNASWEPDIWGLVRREVESAASNAQASAALLAYTRLSAQASLAQYYFELRGLDMNQKLLDETVVSYKKLLQYTQNNYDAGVDNLANVVQIRGELEAAQAEALSNGVLRGQYEHAIAMLIGVPAGNFSLKPDPLTASPPAIPVSVPSTLLERRPDIAEAERLMEQANANIGVAKAAYYPALTLSGLVDSVGPNLTNWISLPQIGWTYGSQLADTIYDGGLRSATVRAYTAAYLASVASYRQTVLSAFQNVEDSLVALRLLNEEAAVDDRAVADAKLSLQLVTNQYDSGVVDISSILLAQINAYSVEQTAADVNFVRMVSAVALITALGGGWDVSEIAKAGVVDQTEPRPSSN